MKVVILAAGKGTRMLPLTKDKPKHFIKIKGKPFLHYLLTDLKKAGYNDFGIVVNYQKKVFKEYAKTCEFNITIIEQEKTRGTGDAVKSAKKFVNLEEFVVVMGDNLYSPKDLKKLDKKNDYCYVAGKKNERPELYGVLVEEHGNLKKVIEKPKKFVGDLVNVGLYKFTPKIFDALNRTGLSPRGEYEITSAINVLAEQKLVKVVRMNGYWLDFGKPEDVEKIESFLNRASK